MKTTLFFVLCISVLSHLSAADPNPSGTAQPNIIFVIADDMYPEMFNCLPEGEGKNLTPNLDRLAREGTILSRQYVASPVCTPSRFNCLTGRFASRATNEQFVEETAREGGQTVIRWNSFITEADTTLAHLLNDLGYATGFAGKNHVIEAKGIHFFEDFQADPQDPAIARQVEQNYLKARDAILRSGFDYAGGVYHNNPNFIGLAELAVQNHDWITAAGIEFIREHGDRPFFLYFASTIPHGPTEPERSWKANPKVTALGYLDEELDVLPARSTLPRRIKEAGLEGENKELVLWLDDSIGALLDAVEAHGQLDNTVIFFFNDNGQHAKGTLYQGGVLSPSIVWRSNGFPVGNRSEVPVSNVDFAPTIVDLAGGNSKAHNFDGKSFLPVLNGESEGSDRDLYFELGYARAVVSGGFKYYAVRYPESAQNWTLAERAEQLEAYNETRRFRNMLIVNEDDPSKPFSHLSAIPGGSSAEFASYGRTPAYFDADQLYDLENDPDEQINLASNPEYQDKLAEMKSKLRRFLDDLPGEFAL